MVRITMRALVAMFMLVAIAACGGGGGGSSPTPPGVEVKGVFSGVLPSFNFDFEVGGAAGGGFGGVGGGADGDGGIGAGGALGQFLGADVFVFFPDGRLLGNAPTDSVAGMVTIKPGRDYTGGLLVEIRGNDRAQYFEEGKGTLVPFPTGQVIRAIIPRIDRNIGVTPFSDAGFTLAAACLIEAVPGVCDEKVGVAPGTTQPPEEVVKRANALVASVVNQQVPAALQIDDVTRLPYIVGTGTKAGEVPASSPRGRYGLVNIAFSKQAAMYNTSETSPTLLAIRQLSADLSDGTLDGLKGSAPAVEAAKRTYDPNTLGTELSSALAQQTTRYGATDAVATLPSLVGFGSARYDSYFFEARVVPNGTASTVAIGTQAATPTRTPGQATNYVPGSADQRGFAVFGTMGSGAMFIKTDNNTSSVSKILAVGDNTNGELGSGNRTATSRTQPPFEVSLPGVVTHMAGGFGHTLARLADGSVFAWGDNAYGQLGQGSVGGSLPRALTPTRVTLPAGALSVAAGNASSFALLADGRIFSWGSSWGFGTLGNGQKDTVRATPAAVQTSSGELTGVVQMSVRENDGIALTRDGSVWTWGSFPGVTDATDFVPVSNAGGRQVATRITGLPTTSKVRKVITDQGMFAVLMSDGAVYTWGVYFDITAGGVLADITPVRVLNVPPVRDLMPGAFQSYGQRATDRDTALAADYGGRFHRIRGRVAELYDPANPLAQRRPKGQAPRPDCGTCHTVQPKRPDPLPTTGAACGNIPAIIQQLLTSQSSCETCHNGEPLSNRPALPVLNCVKPTLPPPPTLIEPTALTTACSLPATGHPAVVQGVNCASCHNSVIAPTLLCSPTAATFAAPLSTSTTITRIVNDALVVISPGGSTNDASPALAGTISAALTAGQTVQVLRDGGFVGAATVAGTSWSFTDAGLTTGRVLYTARVAASGNTAFGALSTSYAVNVDLVSPDQVLTIASVTDNVPSNVGTPGFTATATTSPFTTDDTTPTLAGTLSTALGSGETLRVLRNGTVVGTAVVSGTTWSFTDNLGTLGNANYAYQVRITDAAGNNGGPSNTFNVNLLAGATATANISTIAGSGTATPSVVMSFNRGLLSGERLVLTRQLGSAAPVTLNTPVLAAGSLGTTFVDALPAQGTYTYFAKIVNDAGNEQTPAFASTPVVCGAGCVTLSRTIATLAIDVNAPAVVTNVTSGAVVGDTTPTIRGTVSGAAPFTGLAVVVIRSATGGNVERTVAVDAATGTWTTTEPAALGNDTYSYSARVQDGVGNRGATSTARSIVVSVLPTFQSSSLSSFNDNVSPVTNATAVSNTETDDLTPTLTVSLSAALSTGQTLTLQNSGVTIAASQSPSGTGASLYTLTPTLTNDAIFRASESEASRLSKILTFTLRAIASDGVNTATQSSSILVRLQPRCQWAPTSEPGAPAAHTNTPPATPFTTTCTSCHTNVTGGPGFTCRLDPAVAVRSPTP
jgi:hypothetical protein